jgi:hypothetical protein
MIDAERHVLFVGQNSDLILQILQENHGNRIDETESFFRGRGYLCNPVAYSIRT